MPVSRRLELSLFELAYLAGFILLASLGNASVFVTEDSGCYVRFIEFLTSGQLWGHFDEFTTDLCLMLRTPGFPVPAALFAWPLSSTPAGVLMLYLTGGACLLLLSDRLLTERIDRVVWSTATLWILLCPVSPVQSFPYLFSIMPEGVAILGLLAMATCLVEWPLPVRARRSLLLGFLFSLVVLARPSLLLPCVAALLAVAVLLYTRAPARVVPYFIIGILPFIAWLAFNLVRFQELTIVPFGGWNFLGIGAALGPVEAESGDSEEFTIFARRLNELRLQDKGVLDPFGPTVASVNKGYNYVMWEILPKIRDEQNLSLLAANRLAGHYAIRAVRHYPRSYLRYVLNQLTMAWWSLPWMAPLLLCFGHRDSAPGRLRAAGIFAAVLHLSHIGLCAAVSVVLPRYLEVTLVPVVAVGILAIARAYRQKVARVPSASLSEETI